MPRPNPFMRGDEVTQRPGIVNPVPISYLGGSIGVVRSCEGPTVYVKFPKRSLRWFADKFVLAGPTPEDNAAMLAMIKELTK